MFLNAITAGQRQGFEVGGGWHLGMPARVRWSDIDGFGHANNLASFRWFEDCRNAYMSRCGFPLVDAATAGPVIAETSCRYRRPLRYEDDILLTARVVSCRERSFRMEYAVWRGGLAAEGAAVCVWMLSATGEKCPLPDGLRRAFFDIDGVVPEVRTT